MARIGDKSKGTTRFCSVEFPDVVFETVTLVIGAVTTFSISSSDAVVLGGVVID